VGDCLVYFFKFWGWLFQPREGWFCCLRWSTDYTSRYLPCLWFKLLHMEWYCNLYKYCNQSPYFRLCLHERNMVVNCLKIYDAWSKSQLYINCKVIFCSETFYSAYCLLLFILLIIIFKSSVSYEMFENLYNIIIYDCQRNFLIWFMKKLFWQGLNPYRFNNDPRITSLTH
jgi:hypothetical protein